MTLLNLNKKTGDSFSAEELNRIGQAIDQNTTNVQKLNASVTTLDAGLTKILEA